MYSLLSPYLQAQIRAAGSGSTVEHMRVPDAERLMVRVAPLAIQTRIASILSAYDDLIEVNQRRIAVLEEMARRLFDEWFVHFRYPGHQTAEMIDTEIGLVPRGWEILKGRTAFTYMGGGTPSKAEASFWDNGIIDWYTPTDVTRTGQIFVDQSQTKISHLGLSKSAARLFPAFSIMMTSRATLGVFAINTASATTNQGFITFIPSPKTPLYYLYHLLRRELPRMESVSSGATFKEITKGALGDLDFLIAPISLTSRFEQFAAPIMEQILIVSRQNTRLRAARDLLLPKLISGEIDVGRVEAAWPEAAE